jgi:hypothetical protein
MNPLSSTSLYIEDLTPEAEAILMSDYSDRELAVEIADTISVRADDPRRTAFLADVEAGKGFWFLRSVLARALVAQGETLSTMNRRRA